MSTFAITLRFFGLLLLGSPLLFAGLISETPSMKDFQTGTEKLTVYTDVPGHSVSVINGYASRAKSDIYQIWVRSAATDNVWVQCFANMTYNRGKEMPVLTGFNTNTANHAYQKHTAGWTHTYANIEMSDNSPVEVEIRKIGSTKLDGQVGIVKSAVHPAHKIIPGSKKDENGRVYFKIDKPCQVVIDINGQMDDHNAAYSSSTPGGRMPDGSPVHSIAFYANPIMAKPVASPTNTILTINPSQSTPTTRLIQPDPANYKTLVFAPGVHFVGPGFKLYPGRNYYIPGDAIVYGNIGNSGVPSTGYRSNGDSINIFGYGSICSIQIPHYQNDNNNPQYPEWNSWVGGKGQGVGVEISGAWDTKLTGVTIIDPANFNTKWDPAAGRNNDQGLVSWVKLHSWRVNGDGFGGYQAVEDSFFRACDDSTYVRSSRRRCTWWKDTNANIFRFVNFKSGGIEDCDVIYARWRDPNGVGSVFEFADGGETKPGVSELNIKMRNIRFHDKHPNPSRLININLLKESFTGFVFENISFYVPKNGKKSLLKGIVTAPWYERLVFKNITYKTSNQEAYDTGTLLTAANFNNYFETNEYVANLLFDNPRNLTLDTVADPNQGSINKSPNQSTHVETTTATLSAVAKPNYVFSHWEGYGINASNESANPLTIRVLDNGTITARFSRSFKFNDLFTIPGTYNWPCPPGVTSITVESRGGGGAAGSVSAVGGTGQVRSGGGAGGSYARAVVDVIPGNIYKIEVGAGGQPVEVIPTTQSVDPIQNGGSSAFTSFDGTMVFVKAVGGGGGGNLARTSGTTTTNTTAGSGSSANNIGTVIFAGGSGNPSAATSQGGSGGAGAGSATAGANGVGLTGGVGVSGGGSGGNGRGVLNPTSSLNPNATNPGIAPGGGGGGAAVNNGNARSGGPGGRGEVELTYFEGLHHFEVTAPATSQAGVPFDVIITAKDASNAPVIGSVDPLVVTSPGGSLMEFDWNNDGIYGDNSGTFLEGVKILKTRNKKAETAMILADAEVFTTLNPPTVTTHPAAFSKLQILLPGETSAPGTPSGKTGTPNLVGIGIPFQITVNAVDAFWNFLSTVTDTVRITSSDLAAMLPANAALVGGTGIFTVTQNSPGKSFLTASNLTTTTQSPGTSSSLTVQGFTWNGDGAANRWKADPATLNWKESSGTPAAYTNGRLVNFNDTSTNQNVDIDGVLTPGSVTVDSSKNYTLGSTSGGSIGGTTGLTKIGSGHLTLTTANTYSGNTIVDSGSLRAGDSSAFGSTGTVTLANTDAALELTDGINISRNLIVSNVGDKKSLALATGATAAIFSGNITNSETTVGDFEVSAGEFGTLTLNASVTGNTLKKTGVGTVVLSGSTDNSSLFLDASEGEIQLGKYLSTGVRAVAGIRRIANDATVTLTGAGNDQIFGGSAANQGVNGIEAGGTLNLNGNSESVSYLSGTGGTVDGGLGSPVLTVGESNVSSWFAGEIVNFSGSLSLEKVGTGIFTLTGTCRYSGTTHVKRGTLLVIGNDRLPVTTALILGNGTDSATLKLSNGNTITPPLGSLSNHTLTSLATSGTGTDNAVVGGFNGVSTLTINNSSDVAYNGRLGGPGSNENRIALTKSGSGTFTLSGTRTYTGPTLVQNGTLALVGGTHASPITVQAGAALGFNLGSHATSTADVNLSSGSVEISGTVSNGSNYKLMTASSFTGPFVLSPAIPGYSLQLQGAGNTELWLVFSDPYLGWAGAGIPFDGDSNNDGVDNGLAWFLGAADENVNATAWLPKTTQNVGALVLEFDCLTAADRGTAVFEVQYGQLDAWAGTAIPGAAGTYTAGVVDFVITDPAPAGGLLKVVATIPASEAASGKVFGRIRGVK